jgi:predicted dehydrogenase
MKTLNFAVIGGGFMGKAHSIALATFPMYAWPAPAMLKRDLIVEVNDSLAEESQLRFGFERRSTSWQEAVTDPNIDVVDVLLPNNMHFDVVAAAIKNGKHVICEKPLAIDSATGRKMTDLAEKAGVVNQVGFNWRLTPAVQLAKKLIEEGAIGTVREFRGRWLGEFFNSGEVPLVWRFKKADAGSGALGDIGSHAIDFAHFLVGDITRVNALMDTYVTKRPLLDGKGSGLVDVDDTVSFLVEFEGGATGFIEASWSAPGHKSDAGFEVRGSTGSIKFSWERMGELDLYLGSDAPDRQGFKNIQVGPPHPFGQLFWPVPGYQISYSDTKVIQLFDFAEAVVNKRKPQTTFRDGLKSTLVEEAVVESATHRKWIDVEKA